MLRYSFQKRQKTLVFREVDRKVVLAGIKGIAQVNPALIMRTGDYSLELTVINEDSNMHILFIDGVNAATKALRPEDSDVISFRSESEAVYNYYEWGVSEPLGRIIAMKSYGPRMTSASEVFCQTVV